MFGALLFLNAFIPHSIKAAGVTIITHGYAGDVNGWITGMASQITNYPGFPGTNSTTYTITLTTDGTSIYYQWSRVAGPMLTNTYSGEVIVKLDWSQMAGGLSAPYDISTYDVAAAASWIFLQTNSITDLGGHALVEFPIHMIGHSRGGSLVNEISRILGTNGVWVDHLTTLDPHPFNNDGNFDIGFPTDASAQNTYINVLFRDNYWQNIGVLFDPDGESANGAYNRQLQNLSGGYNSVSPTPLSPNHSNVHLWYHGTLDFANPASDGDPSNPYITSTERYSWWDSYEYYGINAGFFYSRIGGGNRTSSVQPEGIGYPAIRDGYNQAWDLGAGQSQPSNRTALTSNNGNWPNVIKFDLTSTNSVQQGTNINLEISYQWVQPSSSNATLSIYLDNDYNPLNTNQTLIGQFSAQGSGALTNIYANIPFSLTLNTTNAPVGYHSLYAKLTGGGKTRYLYAPQVIQIISNLQPPVLDIAKLNSTQYRIGVNAVSGHTIVIQVSTNLQTWLPLATNTLTGSRWNYTNSLPSKQQFYRALLSP